VTPDSGDGLTQQEAQARLSQYGYNELPDKKDNPLVNFLSFF
jgi:H+-transporting ATPase